MADSNARLLTGVTAPSRAQAPRAVARMVTRAVIASHARAPRAVARRLAVGGTPVRYLMRALRLDTNPASWIVSGAPDPTGAQYPGGGSGALNPDSITCTPLRS